MCAYLIGGFGNDILKGSAGADTIQGLGGNDSIYGQGGVDSLDGGAGDDYIVGAGKISGGNGNDTMEGLAGQQTTFYVDSVDDVVIAGALDWSAYQETPADFLAHGNTIVYEQSDGFSQYYMPDDVQVAKITALLTVGVSGNEAANYIIGSGFTNYIFAAGGNDTVLGNGGDDIIAGGEGDDSIIANGFISGDEGNDTISGNGALFGGDGDDRITGGSGDDTIVPGDGVDTMDGGNGSDTYMLGDLDGVDTLVDTGTTGRDLLQASFSVDLALYSGIEDVELLDNVDLTLKGSGVANLLTGNTGNNLIQGGSGNDTISGETGHDTLRGDAGNDYLTGGDGADSLDGGTGVDTLLGGMGNDVYVIDDVNDVVTELAGEGRDTVRGYVSYTAPANIEVANLTGTANINLRGQATVSTRMNGNSGNNLITGGSQADGLFGNAGADTLVGGDGSDIYFLQDEDTVIELASGTGVDAIITLLLHTDMAANVEYLKMTDFAESANGSEEENIMFGNGYDNVINGRGGDDDIFTYDGNDDISGGLGYDTLRGSTGNDTYRFARGDGVDLIIDTDATVGNVDTLVFSNVGNTQLWLSRVDDDLLIGVIGGTDSVQVQEWFLGSTYQIEKITAGGKTLSSDRVQGLVNAMSTLTPPSTGQSTLPANLQTQLAGALAQAWV